jgi:CRISPR-associated protein Csx17
MGEGIRLDGCHTTPLSSYLKALGILRLVSEQMDDNATGWWEADTFNLSCNLDREGLLDFFAEQYTPTPIVSPWNGGSGFYPADKLEGINSILESPEPRFSEYKNIIAQIKSWPEMPKTFGSPIDLMDYFCDVIAKMRPGKQRESVEQLATSITELCPPAEAFNGVKPLEIPLAEIEKSTKNKKSKHERQVRSWWKVLKKARNKCTSMERAGEKGKILAACRTRLPDSSLNWVDAVYSLETDGGRSFNPALAAGGTDGRLEFSNTFMQHVANLLLSKDENGNKILLRDAIFGEPVPSLPFSKIGQFDPGRAGGYNQGMEIETKEFKSNPWDFVLTVEGALLLAGAATRRQELGLDASLSSPFTVRFSPVGFSSSEYKEEGRFEVWLPVWTPPANQSEIRQIFSEGRSRIGRRPARTGTDFARSISTLGVDRGISSFTRFAFLKRRGDSNVALPAGSYKVRYRKDVEILEELDPLIQRLDRLLRGFKNVPASFETARRDIEESIFKCAVDADPSSVSALVRALGKINALVVARDRSKNPSLNRPLHGLSPKWVSACDDGGPEVRIAAALSSVRSSGGIGSIHTHIAGAASESPYRWNKKQGRRAWHGIGLEDRLGAVLLRRFLEAERDRIVEPPLDAFLGLHPLDVMPFLRSETDDNKIEELLWGFLLVNWRKWGIGEIRGRWAKPIGAPPLSRAWCIFKLLYFNRRIRDVSIRLDPQAARLLGAGRGGEAVEAAKKRLFVSGLLALPVAFETGLQPMRLLASIMIPVRGSGALEKLVLVEQTKTDT